MHRRQFLAGLGAASLSGLAGCAAVGSTGRGEDYDVGMTAVAFTPDELTVSAGETIVWENTSSRAHTVTAYENSVPTEADFFASGGFEDEATAREGWKNLDGAITSGETFSYTFEVPGTFDYFCIPHEQAGMMGRVVVEE